MQNRDVMVTETSDRPATSWGVIAAVLVIALAIALFVWQPWNSTTTQSNSNTTNSTSVTQPQQNNGANNPGANGQSGNSQSNSNSGTGGNTNP